jgi:hypothetical protein
MRSSTVGIDTQQGSGVRLDVVVEPKDIVGVVLTLDGGEALVVLRTES